MSRRPVTLPFPLAALAVLAAALPAQSPFANRHELPEDRAEGGHSVTAEQCKQWLYTLASPEFEGRQTGHPGFRKAAEFVAAHFEKLGLEARGEDGGYYQTVPWSATEIDGEHTFVKFEKAGHEPLQIPAERLSGYVAAAESAAGPVALLVITPAEPPEPPEPASDGRRRGFRMPEIAGLDALDLANKVVVAYLKPSDDNRTNAMVRFSLRRSLAGKNAAAVLFVQQDEPEGNLRGASGSRRAANPAAAGRRRQPGDTTFGGSDLDSFLALAGLDKKVLEGAELAPAIDLQATVEIATEDKQAPAMNVFAVLPGSDPNLRDEFVVIGSHLDHVGMRGGLHPGADDDGSGTTGVMAISQMFASNPVKPKRSVLFVCFAGEEDGLIGSGYFARNPPIPLESIVAELQMDMIGRDEEANAESRTTAERNEKAEDNRDTLHLVGTRKLAPALHELCLAKNEQAGFVIEYDQEGMFGRSDHANFARMGVPVAFFFTGLHRDYHQTTDTPDKIHYEKLLRVASYVYDIAFDLAQADDRPLIDPELWAGMRGKGSEEPAAPRMDK